MQDPVRAGPLVAVNITLNDVLAESGFTYQLPRALLGLLRNTADVSESSLVTYVVG